MSDWPSNEPLVEQRSPEWFKLRLGKPTASNFDKIVSAAGNISKSWDGYKNQLIAERIFNVPFSDRIDHLPGPKWGITYEGPAKTALEQEKGVRVDPGGFKLAKNGKYGASPDGYIDGMPVEIKCPQMKQQLNNLLLSLKKNYWPQIQGQLLVTDKPKVYFWSWNPFAPPRYQEVTRDPLFLATLEQALKTFCEELDRDEDKARKMGEWKIDEFMAFYLDKQREWEEGDEQALG